MNKAQAQCRIRQPRRCLITGNVANDVNPWASWYYVEPGGVNGMVRKPGVGTVAVKLTKRQLEQALSLIRYANGS
jgi:hypothetical protein